MRMRSWTSVLVAVAAVAAGGLSQVAVAAPGGRTGVEVLPPQRWDPDAPRLPEAAARALHDAYEYATAHPHEVGFPWVERGSGTVHLDAVGDAGREAARRFRTVAGAEVRIGSTQRTFAELEEIKHESISLTEADLAGADAIDSTEIDGENARVIVTAKAASDAFLSGLEARYGADAVAVRLDPNVTEGDIGSGTRAADYSPFYGGAALRSCTAGFSWIDNSQTYMLSAGHCFAGGGEMYTDAPSYVGWVTQYSRENWRNTVGTVYLTGQSVYRGDLALAKVTSGRSATYRIYTGASSYRTVKSMSGRWSAYNDPYCTSGKVSSVHCDWAVYRTHIDKKYSSGTIVRDVNEGLKEGWCMRKGDSGSPAFRVRSDGGVNAVGIHSGQGGGGEDFYGGMFDPCHQWFTDIWHAYYGFPGVLRTG